MRHDPKKLLEDILAAAEDVRSFCGAASFDDYLENAMQRAAVERKFEVIGEALSRLKRRFPEMVVETREAQAIIGLKRSDARL